MEQPTFLLLYKPPCGKWYVHSHKLYMTVDDAYKAVCKFLHKGTPFQIIDISKLLRIELMQ